MSDSSGCIYVKTKAELFRSITPDNQDTIYLNEDMDEDIPETKHSEKLLKIKTLAVKRRRKAHLWVKRILQREKYDSHKKDDKFLLKISNLPSDWSFTTLKEFIWEEYGPVIVIYTGIDSDDTFTGMVVMEFISYTDCQVAWRKLHGLLVNDVKLFAEILDSDIDYSDEEIPSQPKRKKSIHSTWRPDLDIWDVDPQGLYGFKPEFLQSLCIQPPIDRWVEVTNFRCDKSELKEILDLAGQVLQVNVDHRGPKTANVMYSHPIEAVQAVSMLNNRIFYGQRLNVTISLCPVGTMFLPKALQDVGPGLGTQGKPLRDVVKQYERYVSYKSSYVDPTVFRNPDVLFGKIENESDVYIPKKISEMDKSNGSYKREVASRKRSLSPVPSKSTGTPKYGGISPNSDNVVYGNPNVPGTLRPNPIAASMGSCGPSPMSSNMGPVGSNIGPMGRNVGTMVPNVGPMVPNVGPIVPNVGPMVPNVGPMGSNVGPMGPNVGPMGPNVGPMGSNVGPMGPVAGPMSHNNVRPMGPNNVRPMGPNNVGPMGPMGPSGPVCGPMGQINPMGGGMNQPGPMPYGPGFNRPNQMDNGGGPMGPMNQDSCMVELINLPLSTTFALLSEKMAQCGQVMSLQLTTPGCAVVQFNRPIEAKRCFQQYNNCVVLGNRIEVKYL